MVDGLNEEFMTAEEIRQEIARLRIRLAFQEELEEEIRALEGAAYPEHVQQLCDGLKARMKPQSHPKERIRWHMPKGGRIVAAIMIVLMVGVGAAAATLQMVRIGVLKLQAETYPDRTSYSLAYTGNDVEVPESWTGSFYPSYIPEGFTFRSAVTSEVVYMDSRNRMLAFSENGAGSSVDYDTENASISTVRLNGAEATLIQKKDWVTIIWAANNRFFSVDMQGKVEEVLLVAESVMAIK